MSTLPGKWGVIHESLDEPQVLVSIKLIGRIIDKLRYYVVLMNWTGWDGPEKLADELQFGAEGKDYLDGNRCRLCGKPVGGDRNHRCWEKSDAG
jgi:hypothetical protein